ncbi:MAG: TonB-dependent receptor [Alteromonadaceae bacterium]|nr:TonB-dependent receptor [Alteromonadaceae bacterium]
MRTRRFTLSLMTLSLSLAVGSANVYAQDSEITSINVSAQPLQQALLELAEESQVQILFSPADLPNVSSPAIDQTSTVEAAITRLISGKGLTLIKQNNKTFIIKPAVKKSDNAAQQGNTSDTTNEAKAKAAVERIQIVGSNIRGQQDRGTLPVTFMSSEDFENSGITSGAELLSELPQQGAVSFNSERVVGGVNDARGDVSSINLRGLGTGYSLTLLNGRRLVLHPGTQAEDLVPVTTVNSNTLPVSGLKRVEVLRDGAAAIYGTDAIAGVVNYVLNDENDGGVINAHFGTNEGTDRETISLSGSGGWFLNNEKTHITLSASIYDRDMLMTSERDYAASSDNRYYGEVPADFVGDTELDNRTTSTPWGEFSSDSLGVFHIQPDTDNGCVVQLDGGICADSGSNSRDLRFDSNSQRSLSSAVTRYNFYTLMTHELTSDVELYGEALYYQADAKRQREQSGNLSAQRFNVSADAYYNPFGEDVLVRRYRPIDSGTRNIEVKDYSYRLLGGLRGYVDDWDWDSALLYSKANTLDKANRVDTTAFQKAVNSTEQDGAYNIFNGGSLATPTLGDATPNDRDVIDSFMVNIERESETELALWDFKLSNAALFSLPAGDVGFATGVEYRYESFSDTRSPLLNGEQNFIDYVTGEENTLASQVLGSSPTPDSMGSRNVFSAYAEFAVPLLSDLPLVERLDMQLAGRYERFSDVGDIFKPKIAMSWQIIPEVKLRGAYSEGFKAPGLPQINAVDVARSNTRSDPVFGVRQGTLELRNGSDSLKPEKSTNKSLGIVITPLENLVLTIDYWKINQEDVVGILSSRTQILYDALLRSEGGFNENVVRNDDGEIAYVANDYINLLPREISGLDYSASYQMETNAGTFTFELMASNLRKFDQGIDWMTQEVLDAQNADVEAIKYNGEHVQLWASDGSLIRQGGHPEWRGQFGLKWRLDQWGAGARYRYISSVIDTGLYYTNDAGESIDHEIDDWATVNVYAYYRFKNTNSSLLDGTRVTLGARNITDEEPPFSSGTFGYNSSLHSSAQRYLYLKLSKRF